MPRGDRTGPEGLGPLTGRAAGYCSGSGKPGYASWPRLLGTLGLFAAGRWLFNRRRLPPGRGLNRRLR